MSNEWNKEEILELSEEEFNNIPSDTKKAFISNLKQFLEEEVRTNRCGCDCHYIPDLMHIIPCCHQTYVQYDN